MYIRLISKSFIDVYICGTGVCKFLKQLRFLEVLMELLDVDNN